MVSQFVISHVQLPRCKVENQSGLSLICHVYDDQDMTRASIFLRHAEVASQLPKNSSSVSVQLAVLGAFLTSPIHVSLLEAQVLARRTRLVSFARFLASPSMSSLFRFLSHSSLETFEQNLCFDRQ